MTTLALLGADFDSSTPNDSPACLMTLALDCAKNAISVRDWINEQWEKNTNSPNDFDYEDEDHYSREESDELQWMLEYSSNCMTSLKTRYPTEYL